MPLPESSSPGSGSESNPDRASAQPTSSSSQLDQNDVISNATGFVPFESSNVVEQPSEPDQTGSVPLDRMDSPRQPGQSVPPTQRKTTLGTPAPEGTSQRSPVPGQAKGRSQATTRPKPQSATSSTKQSPLTKIPQTPSLYQPTWRQAGRLRQWQLLGKVKLTRLMLVQVITVIALFWLIQQTIYFVAFFPIDTMARYPIFGVRSALHDPPVRSVVIFLIALFAGSRWVLDGLLLAFEGMRPLTIDKLAAHSPEAARSLQRFCRQRNIPPPALGLLPTSASVIFSYGVLPQVTRIVVSQGLLEQLAEDEIATLYANEVGHISNWTVCVMSLVVAVTQLPYSLYRLVGEWGDRQNLPILRVLATLIASASYGLYRLWRWAGFWLSRHRTYYSDRVSVELTGNPNGLARALVKLAIGTTKEIQTQGRTSYLLEGLDLLMPLGHRIALAVGSVYPFAPLESVLEWERTNPYRPWLILNNTHPPMGDRLQLLMAYARYWRLEQEFEFTDIPSAKKGLTAQQWQTLVLQGAPFFGAALGFALAWLLLLLGEIGSRLNVTQISWLSSDSGTLWGLPFVGLSLGILLRINPFFPEIKLPRTKTPQEANILIDLLHDAIAIPLDSRLVYLEGKLIGRSGISNRLAQDLWLQTETGMIRLHHASQLGPIGNLFAQAIHPTDLTQRDVVVTGWFRRSTTSWIDLEMLRTSGGRTSYSYHPIWATILCVLAALAGLYNLFLVGL